MVLHLSHGTASVSFREWTALTGWRSKGGVDSDLARGLCAHGLQTCLDAPGFEATPLSCTWGAVKQPGRCHKECMVSALA